jgi:hypothetical protein
LKIYLRNAFAKVYGLPAQNLLLDNTATEYIQAQAATLGSWDWLYGTRLPFSFNCESRFSWGYIELQMQVESGVIHHVSVYSDAMDWTLPQMIKDTLTGCHFARDSIVHAVKNTITDGTVRSDIIQLLEQQEML